MKGLAIDCRPVVILLAMTLGVSAGEKAKSKAEYYDLGGFHYEVTTDSKAAQLWFDRGLAMCYGFNHEEGVRCFEKAIVADPGMAMGYWGIAYALGPNINRMEIEPAQIAKAEFALQLAKLHAESCTELERELITALSKRYATPVPHDRDPLNRAYASSAATISNVCGPGLPSGLQCFHGWRFIRDSAKTVTTKGSSWCSAWISRSASA